MNKTMKRLNKISKIFILLILMVLGTSAGSMVNAIQMNYDILCGATGEIWYCSEHGAPMPGSGSLNSYYTSGGAPNSTDDPGTLVDSHRTSLINGLSGGEVSESTYNSLNGFGYSQVEISEFSKVGESYTTPTELYVLLNGGGYSDKPYQNLWWTTPAGKGHIHSSDGTTKDVNLYSGSTGTLNGESTGAVFNEDNRTIADSHSLLNEFKNSETNTNTYIDVAGKTVNFAANNGNSNLITGGAKSRAKVFDKYIKKMTKKSKPVCGDNGFSIKYKFDWVTGTKKLNGKTINFDNPTVSKRDVNKNGSKANKFIVGPFAVDYVHSYAGNEVFSEITKMEIVVVKADGTKQTLVLDGNHNDFNINQTNKNTKVKFPDPNSVFYVELDDLKDVTRIDDFKVYFRYMNAKGKYELFDGTVTYKNSTVKGKTTTDSQGNKHYYLTVKTVKEEKNAQTVARKHKSVGAEKWYENVDISRRIDISRGEINISKIIKDNGKEIDYSKLGEGENKAFYFNLKVNGAIEVEGAESPEKIKVLAGSSATSRVYYWNNYKKDKDGKEVKVDPPTFELREIAKPGYKTNDIREIKTSGHGSFDGNTFKGRFLDDTALSLEVENGIDRVSGNLEITKKSNPVIVNGKTYDVEGNYTVNVKVYPPENGTFIYNGVTYGEGEQNKQLEENLTVGVNQTSKLPHNIEWIGDKNPRYEVTEVLPENSNIDKANIKINPSTGEIVAGGKVAIEITNQYIIRKAKIHIIKRVDIGSYEGELKDLIINKVKDQTYEFDINVDGYDKENTGPIKSKLSEDGKEYIWEYTTGEYLWVGDADKGPAYTIEEDVNGLEGTTFVSGGAEGKVHGTLVENAENDYKVDNNLLNQVDVNEKLSKLKIIKKVDKKDLEGQDYKIDIKLYGAFTYKGKFYNGTEEKPIRLTNLNDTGVAEKDDEYIVIPVGKSEESTTTSTETPSSSEIILSGASTEETSETTLEDIVNSASTSTSTTTEPKDASNAQGEYNAGDFIWYDCLGAPTYKVSENALGMDLKSISFQPPEGVLTEYKADDDTSIVTIIVRNNGYDTKEGKIHIIKTLDNYKDMYTDEQIQEIKENMKFTFDVYIDRNADDNWEDAEKSRIEIYARGEVDKLVWEWEMESPVTWKENEPTPKYKVEEVDLPEGIEFDSAEGGTVEGTAVIGTLKEIGTQEKDASGNEITIYANDLSIHNKVKPEENNGKLTIKKNVTDASLEGKEFKFKVTLKGVFAYNGEKINGETTIENVIVKGGQTTTIDGIKWGKISDTEVWGTSKNPPTYIVEEEDSNIADCISITNATGTIKNGGEPVVATFTNEPEKTSGKLEITKRLSDGQASDKKFEFEVKIGNAEPYTIELAANQTYTTGTYEWSKAENAPSYTVKETKTQGAQLVNMTTTNGTVEGNTASGTLQGETTVKVTATNKFVEKSGQFKVLKQVLADEKYVPGAKNKEFEIKATVIGNYTYGSNKTPVTDSHDFKFKLKGGEIYTSEKIYWAGDNAPIVVVSEDLSKDTYKGWKNISISNNNATISEGTDLQIVVSNEYKITTEIDLTVKLAGDVWEDIVQDTQGKNTEESRVNGRIDGNEERIKGVQVYVYKKGTNELAKIYKDGLDAPLTQPITTLADGHWEAPRVSLADDDDMYEVRFVYDGQTYEPTKFLNLSKSAIESLNYGSYSEDVSTRANLYMKATPSKRNYYSNTSMARDINRNEVNSRIEYIYGNSAINNMGDTTGKINGSTGEQNVYYKANVSALGNEGIKSKLVTTNSDGVALDLYKATASTLVNNGGLAYPSDKNKHLESVDTNIKEDGTNYVYHYSKTYDYTLHINLGLTKRKEADVEIYKDLVSAKVVVNDRLINYKFNKISDLGKDIYTRTIEGEQLSYELGLYKTDYYYRAEMYQTSGINIDEYQALSDFYDKVTGSEPGKGLSSTELEVYLTYKISMHNGGDQLYTVKVNEVNDYYDSTFKLLTSKTEKYVNTVDGNIHEGKVEVGTGPYFQKGNDIYGVTFNTVERNIKGSDGVTYNKASAKLGGIPLESGENADIYMTFQIEKGSYKGVQEAIELGGKSNVAEISNYSTIFTSSKKIAGKIDTNSAPGNINITAHNEKKWYEDDTDAAPVLKLDIADNIKVTAADTSRTVNGIAWEDNKDEEYKEEKKDGIIVKSGYGVYDESTEPVIGGLTTQLVEKIKVQKEGESAYTEYDFVWPTNMELDSLGGMTIKEVTGFDSTVETSRLEKDEDGNVITEPGEYEFNSTPVGNYVVRFLYGNNKVDLEDTGKITGSPTAYIKTTSGKWEESHDLAYNYDEDSDGKTSKFYNGQDYKSTAYQTGFDTLEKEWYGEGADGKALKENRVSDARDNEARRLEVIANSETITNVNGAALESANYNVEDTTKDIDYHNYRHSDLLDDYYMFADTAKLNLTVESLEKSEAIDMAQTVNGDVKYGNNYIEEELKAYTIPNIDFGLIGRPENRIVLDKEVSSIKLTTNDGKDIFNAVYDINYTLENKGLFATVPSDKKVLAEVNGKYLIAEVTLNKDNSTGIEVLQALDKIENKLDNTENTGTQNFRFINIEDEILQGTTVELKYKLTAINVGEHDYTTTILRDEVLTNGSEEIRNANEVKQNILDLAAKAKEESMTYVDATKGNSLTEGEYIGKYYYTGTLTMDSSNKAEEVEVQTRIRQVVDFVDADGTFLPENNKEIDKSWMTTTVTELTGNGYSEKRLLDGKTTATNDLLDDHSRYYITEENKNVILSVDAVENDTLNNEGFETKLIPIQDDGNMENSMSSIELTVTKVVSAQEDAENLAFDNISEIVKYENSVGRRDMTAVPGNSDPKLNGGEFPEGLKERDSSATELVTFTPPTGIEEKNVLTTQVLAIVLVSTAVLAAGVVVIKKKVLTK